MNENIADLAGLTLAYDAYNYRLKKERYAGLDLRRMQHRFYEAYTRGFSTVYALDRLRWLLKNDGHSPDEVRVNGVVMNTDDWYRLFEVTPEHKLYLAPERRARIW